MHRTYTTSDPEVILEFDLRSDDGEIAFYGALGNTITIDVYNGTAYTPYTTDGIEKVLNTTTNHALIQGPGRFQVTKPAATSMAMAVSTNCSMKEISGF